VPDEVYELARAQFSETELVNLNLTIVAINGTNRLNIALRTVPGSHRTARSHGGRAEVQASADPRAVSANLAATASALRAAPIFYAW
jgi:hypothetical protein